MSWLGNLFGGPQNATPVTIPPQVETPSIQTLATPLPSVPQQSTISAQPENSTSINNNVSSERPLHHVSDLSPFNRARRQLTLFFAGSAFLLLSTRLARRSMHKRYIATVPRYYTPNNRPIAPYNGGLDALEALNISSLVVASVGMITVGGWMFALDVVNVEELRLLWRSKFDSTRMSEKEVEEELEEWIATVLARKDARTKTRDGG